MIFLFCRLLIHSWRWRSLVFQWIAVKNRLELLTITVSFSCKWRVQLCFVTAAHVGKICLTSFYAKTVKICFCVWFMCWVYVCSVITIAGFNPVWEETLSFTLHMPEMALVRFLVWDHDPIGRDFVGQRTVAFSSLMPGERTAASSVWLLGTPWVSQLLGHWTAVRRSG